MRWFLVAVSFGFGLLAAMTSASAAPQNLLLVAKGDDLQFRCVGGECFAEATSICLQYERATPEAGTPYELVDEARYGTGRPDGLTLIGKTADGGEKSLPLETMGIVSERGHAAVRFNVAESTLQEHGLVDLRLRVAHNAVLAPVWQVGDPNPQLESDIELSMGPERAVAERTLELREPRVVAAQILRDTMNGLPRKQVASTEQRTTAFAQAIEARQARTGQALPDAALAQARDVFAACGRINDETMWYRGFHTKISRYRDCLGQRHDTLIKDVNESYWKTMRGAGS